MRSSATYSSPLALAGSACARTKRSTISRLVKSAMTISSGAQPLVVGIEAHLPRAAWAGHHVEVIHLVPRRCRHGVEAAWHEHEVTVARGDALVERAIRRVHPLQ